MAHAIRIRSAKSAVPDDITEKANSVRDSFTQVLENQEKEVRAVPESDIDDRPEHVYGLYRFDDSDDKAEIIEEFSEDAFAGVDWYVLHSHVCTHDKDEGGPCDGWQLERERGNVPEVFRE